MLKSKSINLVALVIIGGTLLGGCAPTAPQQPFSEESIDFVQLKAPVVGQEIAVIKTSIGDIKMVLFKDEAPKTVEHFKKLVEQGFYDNKPIFAQPGMETMVSGADDDTCATGAVVTNDKKPIESEITTNLWHFNGAVSAYGYEKGLFNKKMVSDSRFFIIGDIPATAEFVSEMEKYEYPKKVIDAYKENGGLPQYTGYYTVFGQVYEGLDKVNEVINSAKETDESKGMETLDAKIDSIILSTYSKDAVK